MTSSPTSRMAALEEQGFAPSLHEPAFKALRAVGMLRSSPSPALGEHVLYSPYVWGTEAVPIAEFMQRLPANEREVLAGLSRTVAEHPGSSVEGPTRADDAITHDQMARGAWATRRSAGDAALCRAAKSVSASATYRLTMSSVVWPRMRCRLFLQRSVGATFLLGCQESFVAGSQAADGACQLKGLGRGGVLSGVQLEKGAACAIRATPAEVAVIVAIEAHLGGKPGRGPAEVANATWYVREVRHSVC